jgi:hypothetical protein
MKRQHGATLIVVLVMLVVLTLLAVAGMRMSNSSLQIVGNMQARRFVDNVAHQANEDIMNSIVPFNSPSGAVTLRSGGTNVAVASTPLATLPNAATFVDLPSPAGVKVAVYARNCLFSAPASGYSAVQPIVPEDNLWEYRILVTDGFTQATTSMVQGAKIRQLSGSCS